MSAKKIQTAFICQNCGSHSPKWLGKCPQCGQWNTFVEEIIKKGSSNIIKSDNKKINKPQLISDIDYSNEKRIVCTDDELNRVLGGGIVPGSLVLLGGDPGIGKSTLMLQFALSSTRKKILYVSGEESEKQIKMRAERINKESNKCFILTETSTQNIFQQIKHIQPDILVIDSIQTLHTDTIDSSAGSVSQIRECTAELIEYAKNSDTAVFLIGHINKDGAIAGPKILEHMVDTVLQFEGDRNHVYRILRVQKNRFGATSEIGIYEMIQKGLRQVKNPSEVLISEKEKALSGHAIAATIEGIRPLMIEVQALVSTAVYGTPQRSCTGFNSKRLNMLLAVLEKRAGFNLVSKDVFINITGGISVVDPALDLAVIAAILSSCHDIPISQKFCFASEIGLSGEMRPISKTNQRIQEAEKLGFQGIFISSYTKLSSQQNTIKLHELSKVESLVNFLF